MPFHTPHRYAEMGFAVSFLVPAALTGERYCLIDYTMPAGFGGPSLHRHATDESIFVLEGAVGVHLDGVERVLGSGEAAHIGCDEPHSFWNHGDAPARCLFVGDRRLEAMLAEIGTAAADGVLTAENVGDVVPGIERRHGVELLGPPPSRCRMLAQS